MNTTTQTTTNHPIDISNIAKIGNINWGGSRSNSTTDSSENEQEEIEGQQVATPMAATLAREELGQTQLEVVSILNLVVDHVMSQPTPFEPEEYKWMRFREHRKELQKQNEEIMKSSYQINDNLLEGDESSNDDNGSGLFGDTDYDDDNVQVPVIRIFGPIVKGRKLLLEGEDCH